MNIRNILITKRNPFLILFACVVFAFSQENPDSIILNLVQQAENYEQATLYDKSLSFYKEAIQLAKNHNTYLYLQLKISLAELNRKIGNYSQSLRLLYSIPEHQDYPDLIVRKHARLAAVYNEMPNQKNFSKKNDSVFKHLQIALQIAQKHGFQEQLAVIYNELGYTLSRIGANKEALPYLEKSRMLFLSLNDLENHANATLNYLNVLWNLRQIDEFLKVKAYLFNLIREKKWYALKARYFSEIERNYYQMKNDSFHALKAEFFALQNTYLDYITKNDLRLKKMLLIYETDQLRQKNQSLQEIVELKERLVQQERIKMIILLFLLLITLLLFIIITLSYYKNKNINKKLQIMNKTKELLLSEIKHRVKNNLQMAISILDLQVEQVQNGKTIEEVTLDTQNRLQAIALLYDQFLDNTNLPNTGLKNYLNNLVNLTLKTFKEQYKSSMITVTCDIDTMEPDKLLYLSMIIVELLTNSFKHAFQFVENPVIQMTLTKSPTSNEYLFRYSDNGCGFHPQAVKKGTGSHIIEGLCQQMKARYSISSSNGFSITLQF